MAIKLKCECGKQLVAKDDASGKKVRCPSCQRAIAVPSKQETAPGLFENKTQRPTTPASQKEPVHACDDKVVRESLATLNPGFRFWVTDSQKKAALKKLGEHLSRMEESQKKQINEFLESEAVKSGNVKLWELIRDSKVTKGDWAFYARAMEGNSDDVANKATLRLFDELKEPAGMPRGADATLESATVLAIIESSLRRRGRQGDCYLVMRLAANQHAGESMADTIRQLAEKREIIETALRGKKDPTPLIAAYEARQPHKSEGPLCLGARKLLNEIQEGKLGALAQRGLEAAVESARITEAAMNDAYRRMGIP